MLLVISLESPSKALEVSNLAERYGITCHVIDSLLVVKVGGNEESLLRFLLGNCELRGCHYLVAEDFSQELLELSKMAKTFDEVIDQIFPVEKVIKETKVAFQPIFDLRTGEVYGYEGLCRPPISVAELLSVGRITPLYVEKACKWKAVSLAKEKLSKSAKLFLNYHPRLLGNPEREFFDLFQLLFFYDLERERIVVELTEHERIDAQKTKEFIEFLRKEGIGVALDDFGRGFINLLHLVELKPDYVKVDMELTRGIHEDTLRQAIVMKLLEVCSEEGMKVVAEGIEKEEELQWLKNAGVELGQGYLLGKPEVL